MTTTTDDIIRAATSVARDVAEGRLTPSDVERQAVSELTATMLPPAEPGSDLAQLRIEVSRRVLAEGGLPADELHEWWAVQRRREKPDIDAVAPPAVKELPVGLHAQHDADGAVLDHLGGEDDSSNDDTMTTESRTGPNDEHMPPQRGDKFGGYVAACGFHTPVDNHLRGL